MDASLQSIAILLVVLLLSMSIHEMMHAFAADWLGDPTARVMGRVSLNPIRHMIGPLTNLAIAAIAALLFNAVHPAIGSTAYDIFRITIMLNAGLFVFNSIPWPPLDGSRLLYAFAPRGLQEVMESVERMGIAGLAVFIFLFYSFGGFVGDIITKLVHLLAPGLII
jgi:Zn-dependent protease